MGGGATDELVTAYVIPLVFTWACFVYLVGEHSYNLYDIEFQALLLRICLAFPFVSTVFFLELYLPYEASYFLHGLVGLGEGLLLVEFAALMIGWSWVKGGDVFKSFLESEKTNVCCACRAVRCGKEYTDGEEAMWNMVRQVFQLALVKPLIEVFTGLGIIVNGDLRPGFRTLLEILNIVSLVVAFRALIYIYQVVDGTKDSNGEPSLRGSGLEAKFFVVKLLFAFLILNGVFIAALSDADMLVVPDWMCLNNTAQNECEKLYEGWILLMESAVASILIVFTFRAKPSCMAAYVGTVQGFRSEKPLGSHRGFYCKIIKFFDINSYFVEEAYAHKFHYHENTKV